MTGPDGDITPPNENQHDASMPDAQVVIDAPPPIDAPPATMAKLTVSIAGPAGTVTIVGAGSCTAQTQPCTIWVVKGPQMIKAIADDKPFEKWTSMLCMGQMANCNAMVNADAALSAKFH